MKTNEQVKGVFIEALKSSKILRVVNVDNVNHTPHPYTIGPSHIAYASKKNSGMLTEDVMKEVQCAFRNCNKSYDEHTSDKVLLLQLKKDTTSKEANKEVKAFVETEEKFIIK